MVFNYYHVNTIPQSTVFVMHNCQTVIIFKIIALFHDLLKYKKQLMKCTYFRGNDMEKNSK